MSTRLQPGDRVSFKSPYSDRRLRATVVEHMDLTVRGHERLIPVCRFINRKNPKVQADQHKPIGGKVRWFPRGELRKLPNGPAESH
jgi:hypothetical protein